MKRKILASIVILCLLSFSRGLMAEEKRGAEVLVRKKDGQEATGELIAVKQSSLLMLDSRTGNILSIGIGEIAFVKIIKESKARTLGVVGFAVGALFGVIIISDIQESLHYQNVAYEIPIAAGGAILGVIYGAFMGKDIIYQIEGQSETEIKGILEQLRREGRVPDAQ